MQTNFSPLERGLFRMSHCQSVECIGNDGIWLSRTGSRNIWSSPLEHVLFGKPAATSGEQLDSPREGPTGEDLRCVPVSHLGRRPTSPSRGNCHRLPRERPEREPCIQVTPEFLTHKHFEIIESGYLSHQVVWHFVTQQ